MHRQLDAIVGYDVMWNSRQRLPGGAAPEVLDFKVTSGRTVAFRDRLALGEVSATGMGWT